jgi:phosphoribosylformylglycinamidine synthase
MSRVPALVVAGPGTNRDHDVELALELAGASVQIVLADELIRRPQLLDEARLAVVAGGFSYADSLGAGRMLALDLVVGLGDRLRAFVDAGRPLIGICNGFQVLTRTGLLPGALGHNAQGRFDCRWVVLDPVPSSVSVWTRSRLPAATSPGTPSSTASRAAASRSSFRPAWRRSPRCRMP